MPTCKITGQSSTQGAGRGGAWQRGAGSKDKVGQAELGVGGRGAAGNSPGRAGGVPYEGAGPGGLGGGPSGWGGPLLSLLYRRQACVCNTPPGSQPPPPTGNVPTPIPSFHCGTAANFLSMVTSPVHESLSCANSKPSSPKHPWGWREPGVLSGLIRKSCRVQMQRRGQEGRGVPESGVGQTPDQLGPQKTLGRSWLWRHWTSWTGVWISWRHCRRGTQWGRWPPTR